MCLSERVKSAALIVISYFWYSNQLCKLEKNPTSLSILQQDFMSLAGREMQTGSLYSRCLFGLPTPYLLPFMGCMLSQT